KKPKSPVDLLRVLDVHKGDYGTPTPKSKNRYIPYASDRYKGKTYIYMEGDSSGDEKYAFMSDTTDVTSSESEYEEFDINDIYAPRAPKYKTLIEVVLEPSGNNTTASGKNTPSDTQNDIQNDGIPSSKITDNEWNTLKDDFISNMLQNEPNTEPNILHDNLDNNTHPTPSHNKLDEKPFITSIHDRDLYTGEEYSYNVNMVNSMDDIPINRDNNVYSGIDLINDSLNSNNVDIYDELLKRKENELFGTNHVKQTSIHSVAKPISDDPIHNQLNLFHTWLDRHRDMCEKLKNDNERLAKLKEEWENETHSGNTLPSDSNKTLNTDVSIQIHMDNPKPINQFTNMDTILEDLEKYNEPYYYDVQDDIYYDVNDETPSVEDIPMDHNKVDVPSKVQIEMDVNTKLVKEKYPIGDVWDI
ncbi:acidic terminal segment protein, partial [Plasmodium falciparum Palo Alto/Uganda]